VNVLVTGACGRVGRATIDALSERHSLRLVDCVAPAEATLLDNSGNRVLRPLQTKWPFATAEITDPEAMLAAMDGVEAVVHLAGHLWGYPEHGVEAFRTNALGTFVALDAARQAGISRILTASSINAFGTIYWRLSNEPAPYESMPLTEDFDPVPEDPYSLSKLVGEETCAAFARAYGLTAIALRFGAVWSHERYVAPWTKVCLRRRSGRTICMSGCTSPTSPTGSCAASRRLTYLASASTRWPQPTPAARSRRWRSSSAFDPTWPHALRFHSRDGRRCCRSTALARHSGTIPATAWGRS